MPSLSEAPAVSRMGFPSDLPHRTLSPPRHGPHHAVNVPCRLEPAFMSRGTLEPLRPHRHDARGSVSTSGAYRTQRTDLSQFRKLRGGASHGPAALGALALLQHTEFPPFLPLQRLALSERRSRVGPAPTHSVRRRGCRPGSLEPSSKGLQQKSLLDRGLREWQRQI